jgi:hypothetical protein
MSFATRLPNSSLLITGFLSSYLPAYRNTR